MGDPLKLESNLGTLLTRPACIQLLKRLEKIYHWPEATAGLNIYHWPEAAADYASDWKSTDFLRTVQSIKSQPRNSVTHWKCLDTTQKSSSQSWQEHPWASYSVHKYSPHHWIGALSFTAANASGLLTPLGYEAKLRGFFTDRTKSPRPGSSLQNGQKSSNNVQVPMWWWVYFDKLAAFSLPSQCYYVSKENIFLYKPSYTPYYPIQTALLSYVWRLKRHHWELASG